MANQDVRYYLNGMSFEVDGNEIKTVATDGHRLAIAQKQIESASLGAQRQLIIPKKRGTRDYAPCSPLMMKSNDYSIWCKPCAYY